MPVGTKDIERPLIDQSIPSAQPRSKLTKNQDATPGKDVRFPYLGPVKTSLFDHVPQDWWMDVFGDEFYLKTDGDVVEDPAITQAECQDLTKDAKIANILNASEPNKVVRVLDLCCGQGRHSIELARMYPHLHLHGHDSSAFLINLAKDRTKSVDAERLHFTVGDCRYVPAPDAHFDLCIVMGNSFGYFAQEKNNQAVLNEIFRVLKKGGMVVLDLANPDVIAPQQQRQSGEEEAVTEEAARSYSWEWIDDAGKFLCVRERETTKDGKRVASRETVIDTTKGVVRDNFYEERLYDSREVKSILQKAGFEIDRNDWARLDMNENGEMIETDTPAHSASSSCPSLQETWNCAQMSQRNQDLGMMAQRVLFKGTKMDGVSSLRSSPLPKPLSSASSPHRQTPTKARRSNAASPTHLHQALTGAAAESAASTLPSSIAVITGDPRRPCREKLNGVWNPEDVDTQERMLVALRALGYVDNVSLFHYHQHDRLFQSLSECSAELVFNLCDEGYENDATKELHIPSLLELQGIRYTGAGPIGLAVCYDKQWVNATAQKLNIDVPYEVYLKTVPPRKTTSVSRGPSRSASPLFDAAGGEQYGEVTPASIRDQIRQLGLLKEAPWPLFIKPIKGDNSIGITAQSICRTEAEVVDYIYSLTQRPYQLDEFLIQEYLEGEEYTVGIVGNKGHYSFLPILQLDYSKIKARNLAPIQGYEAKWDPESAYWSDIGYKKASLPRHQVEQLQQDCIRLFERFLCRDYARFDFRATNDGLRIKLLEVNPNPGWCWDGKMAKMVHLEMGAAGADVVPAPSAAKQPEITRAYLELIRRILEAAWKEQLPAQQAEEQRQQGQVSR